MNRELKVGDRIRDNDPRVLINRVLEVSEVRESRVVARDLEGRAFLILKRRIHTDGKPRRSGFSLVEETK